MVTATLEAKNFSLEEFLINPPDSMEWVNGELLEKQSRTFKGGRIQLRLGSLWREFAKLNFGGEVCVETPCRTLKQVRRPDVAYITPELMAQHGEFNVLPVSFPLVAEIVSPNDLAEDVLLKAQEYLDGSGEEVWLVFPLSQRVLIITQNQTWGFASGDTISTQIVLPGFSVPINELLA